MSETPDAMAPDGGKLLRAAVREPFFQFLALAGLLFLAQGIFSGDDREVISVDSDTQAYLFQQRQDLMLRPLTDEEKREAISDFIEEELLVREANKRGFADSSRIRRLLLQNMRFFIAGDLPEPSTEELQAFFEENKSSFQSPPSFELDHILFTEASDVPEGLNEQLNGGADPDGFGDEDFTFGRKMRFMDEMRLIAAFGRSAAQDILALPQDDTGWHGPFISDQGQAHFLRITQRNPPSVPEFETARDWVSAQWMTSKSRELMDAELSLVRPNYRIEIAEPGSDD